jgi:hypothetical protein
MGRLRYDDVMEESNAPNQYEGFDEGQKPRLVIGIHQLIKPKYRKRTPRPA